MTTRAVLLLLAVANAAQVAAQQIPRQIKVATCPEIDSLAVNRSPRGFVRGSFSKSRGQTDLAAGKTGGVAADLEMTAFIVGEGSPPLSTATAKLTIFAFGTKTAQQLSQHPDHEWQLHLVGPADVLDLHLGQAKPGVVKGSPNGPTVLSLSLPPATLRLLALSDSASLVGPEVEFSLSTQLRADIREMWIASRCPQKLPERD